jgi:hypothetical protein
MDRGRPGPQFSSPSAKLTLFPGQTCRSALPCTSGSAGDGELIHRQNRQRAENWPPSRTITYGQRSTPVTWMPRTASRVCNTVSDPPMDFHRSKVTRDFFESSSASALLILTAEQRQQLGTNRRVGERVTQSCSIALDPRTGIVHPPRGLWRAAMLPFRSRTYARALPELCILPSWCADSGVGEYANELGAVKNFLCHTSLIAIKWHAKLRGAHSRRGRV